MSESISAADQVDRKSIASVHSDILQSHVLTRLDGPSLASFSSASSVLHHLSSEERLWKTVSTSTWPSINTPRVQDIISTFPSGHRSFFSDSYPLLTSPSPSPKPEAHSVSDILISSVDIYYKGEVVFSRTQELDTRTSWFKSSPLQVELLDPKEYVPISVIRAGPDACLEENLTLSWIIIDPARKRAANISSNKPVSVQRHWLTGDMQARYATVLRKPDDGEYVMCGVVVTCGGGKEGEEMNVREVSMQVEDMEGKTLNGEDSLMILQGAVVNGGRRRGGEGRKRREYEEFAEMKRRRRERKQRRERAVDLVFIGISVTFFVAFWSYVLLRR